MRPGRRRAAGGGGAARPRGHCRRHDPPRGARPQRREQALGVGGERARRAVEVQASGGTALRGAAVERVRGGRGGPDAARAASAAAGPRPARRPPPGRRRGARPCGETSAAQLRGRRRAVARHGATAVRRRDVAPRRAGYAQRPAPGSSTDGRHGLDRRAGRRGQERGGRPRRARSACRSQVHVLEQPGPVVRRPVPRQVGEHACGPPRHERVPVLGDEHLPVARPRGSSRPSPARRSARSAAGPARSRSTSSRSSRRSSPRAPSTAAPRMPVDTNGTTSSTGTYRSTCSRSATPSPAAVFSIPST